MTPFDLIDRGAQPPGLQGLKTVQRKLANAKIVTVPILRAFNEEKMQVLKVFIDYKDPKKIPKPMSVAAKGALNLMELNQEKATPTCGESSSVREDSDVVSSVDQISYPTQQLAAKKVPMYPITFLL